MRGRMAGIPATSFARVPHYQSLVVVARAGLRPGAGSTLFSADTYRAIAPSIQEGVLHSHGDAIELTVENSRKVAAAVAEFRRTLPVKKPAPQLPMHERLAELDKRCSAMIAEFEEISEKERRGENWLLFTATLARM